MSIRVPGTYPAMTINQLCRGYFRSFLILSPYWTLCCDMTQIWTSWRSRIIVTIPVTVTRCVHYCTVQYQFNQVSTSITVERQSWLRCFSLYLNWWKKAEGSFSFLIYSPMISQQNSWLLEKSPVFGKLSNNNSCYKTQYQRPHFMLLLDVNPIVYRRSVAFT